jgi:hypothetical protein
MVWMCEIDLDKVPRRIVPVGEGVHRDRTTRRPGPEAPVIGKGVRTLVEAHLSVAAVVIDQSQRVMARKPRTAPP